MIIEKVVTSSTPKKKDDFRPKLKCVQWDENTPGGLQKKKIHIAAVELAWRGNEAAFPCYIF